MDEAFSVLWSRSALDDLEQILEYVSSRDGHGAAEDLGTRLMLKIESLSSHPKRCRIVPELADAGIRGYRELIESPYRVFFRIHGEAVHLLGILDGRRDLEQILIARALFER